MNENLAFDPAIDSFVDIMSTKDNDKFRALLPSKPETLEVKPKRIAVFDSSRKRNKIYVGLSSEFENEFSTALFLSLADGLLSPYFEELASNRQHLRAIRDFIQWLNTFHIRSSNRFTVLKDYEAYLVNECGLKPQSTGIEKLIAMIRSGLGSLHISDNQYIYLLHLLEATTLSVHEDRVQLTLSSWFRLPWLRPIMGEKSYLKLESAALLMSSFRITVGAVLDLLLSAKQEINQYLAEINTSPTALADIDVISEDSNSVSVDSKNLEDELTVSSPLEARFNSLSSHRRKTYSYDLFYKIHYRIMELKKTDINNSITYRIMFADLVNKSQKNAFENSLKENPSEQISLQPRVNGQQGKYITNVTNIFSPSDLLSTNRLEELLASWLIACLMVQPEQIKNLCVSQFVREYNSSGSLIAIFHQHFKPRSTRLIEAPLFDGGEIEAQALERYLKRVEQTRSNLFSNNKLPTFRYVTRRQVGNAKPSYAVLLTNILADPLIKNHIEKLHLQRKVDPIFLKAYLALDESNAPAWELFYDENRGLKNPRELYTRTYFDAVPNAFFKLSHIKNSTVHSNYDAYREGDLVNQNAHTSNVERVSYINEENKDAVNSQGRITRLVAKDISDNLYRPSIPYAFRKANDLLLQTSIRNISGDEEFEINTLGIAIDAEVTDQEFDQVVVLETKETMLYMVHYLNQVDIYGKALLDQNPKFFESTLLPNVIWMESVISQFADRKMLSAVHKEYNRIKAKLPNIFAGEMKGGVS